jgi:hypothetical protein
MALTAELVARCQRAEPDPGPEPGYAYFTEEQYDATASALLQRKPPGLVWIFAYGSLIWNPAFAAVEHRRATAFGWHRAFCLELTRWRGSPHQPGLMLGLQRGGCCRGLAYRLPDGDHDAAGTGDIRRLRIRAGIARAVVAAIAARKPSPYPAARPSRRSSRCRAQRVAQTC